MNRFCFTAKGADELCILLQIHRNFISADNPESVYVLYGKRGQGVGYISHSVQVHNSHPEPTEGFEVRRRDLDDASALLVATEPSVEPLGVIHTHEGPEMPWPSATDIADVSLDHLHLILCPVHDAYVVYDGKGYIDTYRLHHDDLVNRQGDSISTKMFHTSTPEGQIP